MKFVYKNETTDTKDLEDEFLGEGSEGKVYYYNGVAVKIHNGSGLGLDQEEATYLSEIKTKRILMPNDLIYDCGNKYVGYTTKYVDDFGEDIVYRMKKDNFIREIKLIETDIITLSEKFVYINDLIPENVIYNSTINFVDPGCFRITMDNNILKVENMEYFYDFINDYIITPEIKRNTKKEYVVENVLDSLPNKYGVNMCSFLESDMKKEETVGKYVKRLIKECNTGKR